MSYQKSDISWRQTASVPNEQGPKPSRQSLPDFSQSASVVACRRLIVRAIHLHPSFSDSRHICLSICVW